MRLHAARLRWTWLRTCGVVALATTVLALAPRSLAAASEHPNVLVVLVDQEAAALSLPPLARPNLDRLAKRGLSFTRAYAAYPVCSPSRAALLTGLYPRRNGVLENVMAQAQSPPLDPAIPNLGSVFASRGYATAWFGKWHLSPDEEIQRYGFEHVFSPTPGNHAREGDAQVSSSAAEWMRRRPAGTPWLAVVSLLGPHDIAFPERYEDVEVAPYPVELPASFDDDPTTDGRAPELRAHAGARKENRTPRDRDEWIRYLRLYCHLLERLDPHLGAVLDALDSLPARDRTIVIYTSDHGEMGGAHRMAQKRFLYEESVRVPLYLVYPGVAPATTSDRLASHVDLAPTLATLAGIAWPTRLSGEDLLAPPATDPADETVFAEVSIPATRMFAERTGRLTRMVRTRDWKYVLYPSGWEELYDTAADPIEVRNLAASPEHASRRAELRARLDEWLAAESPAPSSN
jgi:arylsulfatase A-like enzyme